MSVHLDPARKHDFVFLFDVRDGNPNGDPDAGGMPRTDPETGQGLVTDVAIKRKIRNMVALLNEGMPGYDIYVETGTSLNAQHERAYAALNLDPKQRRKSEIEAQQWMCQTFYDVRMFGAVMSTGTKPCGRVQGPMQLTFSRSIDTVLAQEHGITRVTQTRQEDIDKGESTEMGNKHVIPYGLYLGHGHFSAPLARRTGVTSQDLETFWRAMTLMFEHDRASTRGEMAMRRLLVFSHDDPFGRAPAHELFDRVQVEPKKATPRAFTDYTISIDDDAPEGVTLTRVLG
ncbi:type I-C CRISPR-associated protein Cas7/Csd2 [Microbispora siamensis]|uniref:Type I-C CRISPR-associated protein Cas7/Csd2 n=1 Tax=Microbispora siamensis TaxID=564413 RepID=A0ABQ4GEN3_9ACTN|nr:type I-C CRISPR-associated protein Cas7/Csd2 [Microbispora siamensis]GIH59884.1 type I-C CRISPR-associated protein Cas7/Csd2 [Microbispora siamensis]